MKSVIIIFIFLVCSFKTNAQDINPYEGIGKKGKIITLSNGKYTEVHINDSLRRIGSVIVNMNTGTIHKLLDMDSLYAEATLDPTVVGRFYAVDPLTSKYPHYSPYQFSGNQVIHMVELEGLEEFSVNNITSPNEWIWNVWGRRPGERDNPKVVFITRNADGNLIVIERNIMESENNIPIVTSARNYSDRLNQNVGGVPVSLEENNFAVDDGTWTWQSTRVRNNNTDRTVTQGRDATAGGLIWFANSVHNNIQGTVGGGVGAVESTPITLAGGVTNVQVDPNGDVLHAWNVTDQNGNIISAGAAGGGVTNFAVPAGTTAMNFNLLGTGGGAATGFNYDLIPYGPDARVVNVANATVNSATGNSINRVSGIITRATIGMRSSLNPINKNP